MSYGRGSDTHCNSYRVPKSPKLREATDPFRMCNKNTTSDLAGRPSVDSTFPLWYHSFVVRFVFVSEWDIKIVCFLEKEANKLALTTILMENPSRQVNEVCFLVFVFFAALTQESIQQQVYMSTAPLQAHDKLTVLGGVTLYIPKGVDVCRS